MPAVRVLRGEWRELLAHGPFALLFVDAAEPKCHHADEVIDALQLGGMIVLDDFTPMEAWPEERHGTRDPVREIWLSDPRLTALETRVTRTMSVILATKTHFSNIGGRANVL